MVLRFLLPLVIILSACVANEPAPGYLVRVGTNSSWQCGGYAIDPWHIITADHCTPWRLQRALLHNGIVVRVAVAARWTKIDTALLVTKQPLGLGSYAALSAVEPEQMAYAFGYCPVWQPQAGRFARYVDTEATPMACHQFQIDWAWICSGDSGGIVTQDGAVVGMMSKFRGDTLGLNNGRHLAYGTCAVTGDEIAERVAEWRAQR